MSRRLARCLPLLLAAALATAGAASRCKLLTTAPLPVKMVGLQPVISAYINGVPARFMIDTGSFFDFLTPAAAAQFKLPLRYAPPGYFVDGIGGAMVPQIATAKTFSVAGLSAPNALFLVGNNEFGGGTVGLLGQNIFRLADVEFDFANGVLRFVKPQHCGHSVLAYWATPNQYIGELHVRWTSRQDPELIGKASVNGYQINVQFDTGSNRSVLSLAAAKRAGITPDSPGVVPAGDTIGVGRHKVQVWSAPVAKFEIGGELIEHTHVLIGDIGSSDDGVDMLLGSDFFLAHHIYVAYSQDKLYFTYNGGPVFDLNARRAAQTASNSQTSMGSGGTAAATPAAGPRSDVPTDAAGFMRRGMAETSRGELAPAIADFTRACKLAPADADCHYQRGLAYRSDHDPQLALADFNEALKLAPTDYQAHLARAQLQLPQLHADIMGDLDSVDRLAPPEADLRLRLALLYNSIAQYAAGAKQLDLWIEYHADDNRLGEVLGLRCFTRAAADVRLHRALSDCNRAMRSKLADSHSVLWRLTHRTPPGPDWILRDRSLVYLRLGDFDQAIADDDAALAQAGDADERPYTLYLRGLAELRKGLEPQGRADLAAARKLQPGIDAHYANMGLTP